MFPNSSLNQFLQAPVLRSPVTAPFQTATPLDQLLGGLPTSAITELYGAPTTGKTQLVLTLAASLSRKGRNVLLLDTNGTITTQRLSQIALAHARSSECTPIRIIRTVLWEDAVALLHILPLLSPAPDMVAIDSIASLYRTCRGAGAEKRLEAFANRLRASAVKGGWAVVVVNDRRTDHTSDGGAALGSGWRHVCGARVLLTKREGMRILRLEKGIGKQGDEISFEIGAEGVVSSRS